MLNGEKEKNAHAREKYFHVIKLLYVLLIKNVDVEDFTELLS